MSITHELRDFAKRWPCTDYVCKDMLAIADRIDAEHERRCKEQYACGAEDGISASIEALVIQTHGFIELPKDADGEVWHIGDRTESGHTIEAMGLNKHGWYFVGTVNEIDPAIHRHYHAPTVEDVLREFGDWYAHTKGGCDEDGIIAEYAKRLKLAEGEDE